MTNNERRGFITGGTWCVDTNRIVSHWPEEDGLAEYLGEERANGGSGSNFALDIKQLDPAMPVETIAMVGDDEDGRFLAAIADRAGIGRAQMHVAPNVRTQATDAFVARDTHRRTHIFNRGASSLLTPDHFDFVWTRARILHLGLPGVHKLMDQPWGEDANGWVTVLKKAHAAGLRTNLELASVGNDVIAALVPPCLPHLDTIIVNDAEIGALSGLVTVTAGVTDVSACRRAARIVLEKGVKEIVVVHCPTLAIAVDCHGQSVIKPSVNVPAAEIAGANGAGDAFASGMMFGQHEGWSIEASLTLAHATAAASLRGFATTGAIEPWRDCLALANRWGWRGAP